jgi:hypothetical protein
MDHEVQQLLEREHAALEHLRRCYLGLKRATDKVEENQRVARETLADIERQMDAQYPTWREGI